MAQFIPPIHWLRDRVELGPQKHNDVPRTFIRVSKGNGGRIDGKKKGGILAVGRGDCVSPHLPVGIGFEGDASRWMVKYAEMRGFTMLMDPDRYFNGDGFSTERKNSDIGFAFCKAFDNSDGGFDLKGPNAILRACEAGGNSKNYRHWDSAWHKQSTLSLTPRPSGGSNAVGHFGVHATANPITLLIEKLIIRSDTDVPLFKCEGKHPIVINIQDYDISVPKGTQIKTGPGLINWGPKGAPKL
jgi:hypothetical protein